MFENLTFQESRTARNIAHILRLRGAETGIDLRQRQPIDAVNPIDNDTAPTALG